MDSIAPLTLPEWRQAYAEGASPLPLLEGLRQRLIDHSPPEAWITLTSAAQRHCKPARVRSKRALH